MIGKLFLLALCTVSAWAARCRFPIEIPEIDSVQPETNGVTIVVKTSYPITAYGWWGIIALSPDTGFYYPVDEVPGNTKSMRNTESGIEISLQTQTAIDYVYIWLEFDIGCTIASWSVSFDARIAGQNLGHTTGQVERMPEAEYKVKPRRWYQLPLKFRKSSQFNGYTYSSVNFESFRDDSELAKIERGQTLPFEVESIDVDQSDPDIIEKKLKIRFPRNNLYDVVARNMVFGHPINSQFKSNFFSYYTHLYTKAKNIPPRFGIYECNKAVRRQRRENGVYVFPRIAGYPSCLLVRIIGRPLPSYTMIQKNGDQALVPNEVRLEGFLESAYVMPIVTAGQVMEFDFYLDDDKDNGITVRLEGYEPMIVELPDRDFHLEEPTTIELKCIGSGSAETIGIYSSTRSDINNPAAWSTFIEDDKQTGRQEIQFDYDVTAEEARRNTEEGRYIICAMKSGENVRIGSYQLSYSGSLTE